VRQPQVAPLLALALALLLAAPLVPSVRAMAVAGAFLVEFLSGGRLALLSAVSAAPRREPLRAGADRYPSSALLSSAPLVLVHGFTPAGKDDARLQAAAALLARAGFDVGVPTIPGLTRGRLRPDDVEPVVATVIALAGPGSKPVTLVGVSVGAGPALLAAADPRIRERVAVAVSLGGYASALELLRFFLTGEYAFGPVRGRVVHDPELVRAFIAANADLLDAASRRRLDARDPALAQALLAAPPARVRALLEALSPERVAGDIRGRLVVIHGRGDPAIPYTESLRLAATRGKRTTSLALVGTIEHVEGRPAALLADGVTDFLTLWARLYDVLMVRN
jgi:pimeloyl-ACP methyl ester carboxylesterase